jgi:transcriptional regulator with XRE-family HTH domain
VLKLRNTNSKVEAPSTKDIRAENELRAKTVGAYLRKCRQKAGLTQLDLACALSYSSAQFVSNWERGLSLPPLTVLRKLSVVCRIPKQDLVETLFEYQQKLLQLNKKRWIEALSDQSRRRSK